MAEKSEETKPAAARRAARPFVGPAGAAGASSGSRPLLRPAAPGDRSRPAAFAPPLPDRSSLGTNVGPTVDASGDTRVERAAAPALPVAPAETTPDVPLLPTAPLSSIALEGAPTAPVVWPDTPTVAVTLPNVGHESPAYDMTPIAMTSVAPVEGTLSMDAAPVLEPEGAAGVPTPISTTPVRPVTSEMVAIDAFDAFESVWSGSDSVVPAGPEGVASPLDELSLGGGLDGPHLWTEEIIAVPEQAAAASVDPVFADQQDAADSAWPDLVSADIGMPAWLADDAEPTTPQAPAIEAMESTPLASVESAEPQDAVGFPAVDSAPMEAAALDVSPSIEDASAARWPDPLLAEYAPYIPTPSSIGAIRSVIDHVGYSEDPPRTEAGSAEPELDAQMPITAEVSAGAEPLRTPVVEIAAPPAAAVRVSAALERLADRVRSGEIDVSSVAAEAPDTAILASVLAALLGGSSSR